MGTMGSDNTNAYPTGDLMKGKRGLIMGVANDHSIAWGIAHFEMKHHDHGHGAPAADPTTAAPHDHDGDGVPDH